MVRAAPITSVFCLLKQDANWHGTAHRYLGGCHCRVCLAAARAHRAGLVGLHEHFPPKAALHARNADAWPGRA